ncbi:MAG: hypothetical protein WDN25_10705 [Acetobacteraceae bacterium]
MPRVLTTLMLLSGVLVVAGCNSTHQQLAARDQAECESFGFQPGTDHYADCVVQLHAARHQPTRLR